MSEDKSVVSEVTTLKWYSGGAPAIPVDARTTSTGFQRQMEGAQMKICKMSYSGRLSGNIDFILLLSTFYFHNSFINY